MGAEIKKEASRPIAEVLPSTEAKAEDLFTMLRFPAKALSADVSAWTVSAETVLSYSIGRSHAKKMQSLHSRRAKSNINECDNSGCDSGCDCDCDCDCDTSCECDCYGHSCPT